MIEKTQEAAIKKILYSLWERSSYRLNRRMRQSFEIIKVYINGNLRHKLSEKNF